MNRGILTSSNWSWAHAQVRGLAGAGAAKPIGFASTIEDLEPGQCRINSNMNRRVEHIYYMSGQQAYSVERINPGVGERWFCSELDARAET